MRITNQPTNRTTRQKKWSHSLSRTLFRRDQKKAFDFYVFQAARATYVTYFSIATQNTFATEFTYTHSWLRCLHDDGFHGCISTSGRMITFHGALSPRDCHRRSSSSYRVQDSCWWCLETSQPAQDVMKLIQGNYATPTLRKSVADPRGRATGARPLKLDQLQLSPIYYQNAKKKTRQRKA